MIKAVLALSLTLLTPSAFAASDLWVMGTPSGVSTVNPFTLSGWDPYRASAMSLETMAKRDPVTHELIPCLATKWVIDKKAKTLRVTLRSGVLFHNGSEMSAEDVKFSFEAFRDDRYQGAIWRPLWDNVTAAKVIDPHTVEFSLATLEYSKFLGLMLQMRILPESYYGKLATKEWSSHMVGTGPYQLTGFVSNQKLEYTYFPKWWGAKDGQPPLVKKLMLKAIPDRHLAIEMIRKGEVDFYPLSDLATFLRLKAANDHTLRLWSLEHLGGTSVGLAVNLTDPIMKSLNLRKALVMMWDRKLLNDKIFSGQMQIAIDGFDQSDPNYPAGKPLPYSPSAALKLLQADGWADTNKTGVLSKMIDGHLTPLVVPVTIETNENERWVTLFKEDAKKSGVDVKIERIATGDQSWHRLKERKFVAWGDTAETESGVSMGWHTDNYYNFYGYSNPQVDTLLDKMNAEFEEKARKKIARELLHEVRKDVVSLPGLFNSMTYYVTSPRLHIDSKFPVSVAKWTAD